ncbi:MAG: class I SAM-dependent methyltransferase [Pseudonocardiaceae bacterium]
MASLGTRLLEMSFGRPSGSLGRIGGWLMARGNAATERKLVDLADLGRRDVVLVVGPGPGVGLDAAARRSERVIGLDPSEVMLASCRRRCTELIRGGTVRLVQGVAEDTFQPAESVDVVLAVNNVQIWPDWGAGFAELHRVLRPGGQLLLSAHQKWFAGRAGCAGRGSREGRLRRGPNVDLGAVRARRQHCGTATSTPDDWLSGTDRQLVACARARAVARWGREGCSCRWLSPTPSPGRCETPCGW